MAARILAKAAGSTVGEAIKTPRGPMLYGAVNKRFLSTGETGELVCGSLGFGLNPEVELAPPRRLLSNWRDCRRARTCRMWRIRATVASGAAVKITGVGFGTRTEWLPVVDTFRTLACGATPVLNLELLGHALTAPGA